MYASRLGHISAVQFLIENGVSLNERYEVQLCLMFVWYLDCGCICDGIMVLT